MAEEVKSFTEFLAEDNKYFTKDQIRALNENLKEELTPEEEALINAAVEEFAKEYINGTKSIEEFNKELTNEGFLGSLLGGLTGFALGQTVGKVICKVLGIENGLLYNLLTSRLVGAAVGAALGNRF
jgi:hypothetical protein